MLLETINRYYSWALIAILFLNLSQRKIPNSTKKRFATIYLASILLLFEVGVVTIITRGWNHNWAWPLLALCIGLLYALRKRALPFTLHCTECGAKLEFNRIIGGDENICTACYNKAHPEETSIEEPIELEQTEDLWTAADTVDQIDWEVWEPTEVCVLTFLFEGNKVLLIDKKTGLGKGLVNAPGGHIEADETADQAAAREFEEETGITVNDLSLRGTLNFQFKDGLRLRGYVYFADSYTGEMKETDEARPFWIETDQIPYEKMWEDDRYWLPQAIEGKRFNASFIFDDQLMLSKEILFSEEE
ncbi:MAG: 8-oxo-dGTP diphosphatase [Sphaerochaeta sp.]|jgi:8-oxo-dGTP diphosphatase